MPPSDSAFRPNQARGGPDALSGVLVKAMVAATQADGVIDEEEQRRLLGRLDQLGMGSIDRQALAEQLTTPVDPNEISSAASSPEVGLQIYAASVLAVAVDTADERRYLDGLAKALGNQTGIEGAGRTDAWARLGAPTIFPAAWRFAIIVSLEWIASRHCKLLFVA